MKRIAILGILILTCTTSWSQSGWNQIKSATPLKPDASHNSIVRFADHKTGWIVGGAGVVNTTNGGETWRLSSISSELPLVGLQLNGLDTVWILSWDKIYRTFDGGSNWFQIELGSLINNGKWAQSFHFLNANTGFVGIGAGLVLKTTNGGISWNSKYIGRNADVFVRFRDENLGFSVAHSGSIFRTTNGGVVWDSIHIAGATSLESIYLRGKDTVYVSGKGLSTLPYDYAILARSTNAGGDWTVLTTPTINPGPRTDLNFQSAKLGWASDWVGILKTTDGGISWSRQVKQNLSSLSFVDSNFGFAGVTLGSAVIKTTNGGVSWRSQPVIISVSTLRAIQATGVDTVFAVGDGGIIRTIDAGTTWTWSESTKNNRLNAIIFPRTDIGYAVGADGAFFKTSNFGQTWNSVAGFSENLSSIYFTGIDTGWVATESGIFKTTNGGTTWSHQNGGKIVALNFLTSNVGYALSGNTLFKTVDGGAVWSTKSFSVSVSHEFRSIYFVNSDVGFVLGDTAISCDLNYCSSSRRSFVWKTTDGGQTWTAPPGGDFTRYMSSIYFANMSTGWTVGEGGSVFRTTNGGVDWARLNAKTTEDLTAVRFNTISSGFMVGKNGGIYKTSDGGGVSIRSERLPPPDKFTLRGNLLSFNLARTSHVRISFRSISGKLLTTAADGIMNSGAHSVSLSFPGLPSGVYVLDFSDGLGTHQSKTVFLP